jgi:hypothetical protein
MNSNATYGNNGGVFIGAGGYHDLPSDTTYMMSLGANVPYEITGAFIRVPGVQMNFNDGAVTGGGFSLALTDTGSGLNNPMVLQSTIPAGLGDTNITNVYNSVTVQAGNSARLFGDYINIRSGLGTTGIGTINIQTVAKSGISIGDPNDFDGTGTLLIVDPVGTITVSNSSPNGTTDGTGYGLKLISDSNNILINAAAGAGAPGGQVLIQETGAFVTDSYGVSITSTSNDVSITGANKVHLAGVSSFMDFGSTAVLESSTSLSLTGSTSVFIKSLTGDSLIYAVTSGVQKGIVISNTGTGGEGVLWVNSSGQLVWNSTVIA